MIRLFAAVAVPPEIGAGLAGRQQGLAGARWRPAQSLHVTLRFFGAIAEDKADDLAAELSTVGGGGFEVVLSGVGVFGAPGREAVWAGIEQSAALRRLAARCESAARRAGLKAETRVFHPHVTLAYLSESEPRRLAAWIQSHNLLKSPPFLANAFGLYSSWRGETGSRYRLERAYPLD